mmetsp:Transcript_138482/g.430632  ORF Transcript_138482/g.430632 Transcript_138482/m.430632 type:complete len:215 (+) Transcript_138482:119-763(+)
MAGRARTLKLMGGAACRDSRPQAKRSREARPPPSKGRQGGPRSQRTANPASRRARGSRGELALKEGLGGLGELHAPEGVLQCLPLDVGQALAVARRIPKALCFRLAHLPVLGGVLNLKEQCMVVLDSVDDLVVGLGSLGLEVRLQEGTRFVGELERLEHVLEGCFFGAGDATTVLGILKQGLGLRPRDLTVRCKLLRLLQQAAIVLHAVNDLVE